MPLVDPTSLHLFDHVYGTFRPPPRELRPQYTAGVGRRGLFQIGGRIAKENRLPGCEGDWALSPRAAGFDFYTVPLSWLADVELAPPGAGLYRYPTSWGA